MHSSKLASTIMLSLLMGAANSQAIRIEVPHTVPLPESTVTRAQVIADYHMWRLAGLQALTQGEGGPRTEALEYRQAQAKYEWLRASPQFAKLVAELGQRPHALVLAEKPSGEPLASTGSAPSR